jgi:hypothetical protein
LLLGLSPQSKVTSGNWQLYLARRMIVYFGLDAKTNPLAGVEKGHEIAAYAALSAQDRYVFFLCCTTALEALMACQLLFHDYDSYNDIVVVRRQ